MNMKYTLLFTIFAFISCSTSNVPKEFDETLIAKSNSEINIDGLANDKAWKDTPWRQMDNVWLGETMEEGDFKGHYKLLWDKNYIYILAEIEDDILMDIHKDGLDRYWDDDCLEVFIDEDNSKGNHQYNHNAFAYHISLKNKAVDIGPDSIPHYYNHLKSARKTNGHKSTWEVAMSVYNDEYIDGADNTPVALRANKQIGFMIAYCDNDKSAERENFIGSMKVEGEDKNRGWIDAGVFGSYKLK